MRTRYCVQFWCFISKKSLLGGFNTHTEKKHTHIKQWKDTKCTRAPNNSIHKFSLNKPKHLFIQGTFKMCICTNKTAKLSNNKSARPFPLLTKTISNLKEPFPANFRVMNVSVINKIHVLFYHGLFSFEGCLVEEQISL